MKISGNHGKVIEFDYRRIAERAKNKSIGTEKRISKQKIYKISEEKLKKILIGAFLAGAISIVLLISLFKVGSVAADKIAHHYNVQTLNSEQAFIANGILAQNDMYVVPDLVTGNWNNNYYEIEGLSENDLYSFVCYMGLEEAEQIVRVLGYESWDNFLSIKGYFDEEGKPSIRVWQNYEEVRLLNEQNKAKEK